MPSPTFTGLLALWAEGCSVETKRHLAGTDLSITSVFAVYDYLQARRAKMDHPDLARDVKSLRALILRRLDGAERAREVAERRGLRSVHPSDRFLAHEFLEALNG